MFLSTTSRSQRAAVIAALIGIGVVAYWTRLQFIGLYGGHAASYPSWANEHYFGGLSSFYLMVADGIVAGRPYTTLQYPPGYPLLVAAVKWIGLTEINQLRAVQACFDAGAVTIVYALARRVSVTRPWAMGAAAMYAVWPLWAAGSIWPLADSLSVALMLVVLLSLAMAATIGTWSRSAVCGGCIGASALMRPDLVLLILPAALCVAIVPAGSSRFPRMVALLAAFALVMGPWGLHNRRIHGSWVFTSTTGGLGLWEGLGELPNDYGYVLDDSAANHVLKARGYEWSSIEGDRFFRREYLKAWREHPGFVLRVIAARIPRVLFQSERLQPLFFGRARQILDATGLLIALLAAWLRRRDPIAWLVLALPPLYALGSIGLVHYEPRYVRYVQLSYMFGAIIVAGECWRRLSRRGPMFILPASAVLAGAGWYVARELQALHAAAQIVAGQ
jgi:hypothetical protein